MVPAKGGGISEGRIRVNDEIRTSPVRLIDDGGEQIGVVSLEVARGWAEERGLDLVEVSPGSRPPVVRLMDSRRLIRESRKQEAVQVKEVKLRPGLEAHEYEFKIRHARRYVEEGNKVRLAISCDDRPESASTVGQELLKRFADDLEDVATVESRRKLDGGTTTMTLAPLKQS